jgi:hypothetical protein
MGLHFFKFNYFVMKKNVSIPLIRILSLAILVLFLSSFIIHSSMLVETVKTVPHTSENKHKLLKTTVLAVGLLGGAALMRRRFRQHRHHFHRHGGGVGCLGVLGIIGLVILGLVLFPLILVALIVVGIAALFGVRVRRPRRRHRRFD